MPHTPSLLTLEDGTTFGGFSPSWQTDSVDGEVVFTTGMTGYCESLTDPSYAGQILVFTYPLIGNYGVPSPDKWESDRVHARGVIVSQHCEEWSHASGTKSLLEWLEEQKVALMSGVDTRALTKTLRDAGTMLGAITTGEPITHRLVDPNESFLVNQVSTTKPATYGDGDMTVVVVDCGIKKNILRELEKFPVTLRVVPHNYDFTSEPYDGVFLSNGPGDPSRCSETVAIIRKAMENKRPIFGICLGTQLLALAAGAQTYKLPYGHRSHNQPCVNTLSGDCYITSQNHGYAIAPDSLPEGWRISYRNLNDNSVEGISHKELPFQAVQFHPEAAPGPTDTLGLFDDFYQQLLANKRP